MFLAFQTSLVQLLLRRAPTTQTTGTSNNVNFGDVSPSALTGASAQTITGTSGGRDGEILTLVNAGSTAATLASNLSGSSSASNQITTGTGAKRYASQLARQSPLSTTQPLHYGVLLVM